MNLDLLLTLLLTGYITQPSVMEETVVGMAYGSAQSGGGIISADLTSSAYDKGWNIGLAASLANTDGSWSHQRYEYAYLGYHWPLSGNLGHVQTGLGYGWVSPDNQKVNVNLGWRHDLWKNNWNAHGTDEVIGVQIGYDTLPQRWSIGLTAHYDLR